MRRAIKEIEILFLTLVHTSGGQQEADLVKAGNPGLFQSTPKVTCEDWDRIQRLDVRTLLCTNVVQGSSCEWETAVEAICSSDVCRNVGDLFLNLKRVKRIREIFHSRRI